MNISYNFGKIQITCFVTQRVVSTSGLCMHAQSLQSCLTFCDPMTVAHQDSLSLGFYSQEYWSGCHVLLQCLAHHNFNCKPQEM